MSAFQHAALLFDSSAASSRVGARGGLDPERSLIFRQLPYCVDIAVIDGPDGLCMIHGQVVDELCSQPLQGAAVWLGEQAEMARTDEFGQFLICGLDAGANVLWVRLDGVDTACTIPARKDQEAAVAW